MIAATDAAAAAFSVIPVRGDYRRFAATSAVGSTLQTAACIPPGPTSQDASGMHHSRSTRLYATAICTCRLGNGRNVIRISMAARPMPHEPTYIST